MTIYKGDYMNDLALTQVTMTSLELVEFINSQRKEGEAELRHDNFMAKAPKVLGEEGVLKFKDTYTNAQNGQKYPCYRFPKREACLMAMSYSYELQAIVYDRMTALEEQQKKPKELSRLEILQMAIESEQKVIALEHQVNELTPKAKALDTIANSFGQKTITNVAKVLGVQPEKFLRPWMLKNSWIYVGRDGQYHAHAARIKDGHLVEKTRPVPRSNGFTDLRVTVYVTGLGETLLARRLAGEAA